MSVLGWCVQPMWVVNIHCFVNWSSLFHEGLVGPSVLQPSTSHASRWPECVILLRHTAVSPEPSMWPKKSQGPFSTLAEMSGTRTVLCLWGPRLLLLPSAESTQETRTKQCKVLMTSFKPLDSAMLCASPSRVQNLHKVRQMWTCFKTSFTVKAGM